MNPPQGTRIVSFVFACAMFAVVCFCLRSCQIDYRKPVAVSSEAYR